MPGSRPNGLGVSATETPRQGATELWEVANLTGDAHPIHVHLIQFQVISRQPFDLDSYLTDWMAAFPGGTFNGFTFSPGIYIPGFGPPRNYTARNSAGALGGNLNFDATKYLQRGECAHRACPSRAPEATDASWKDTIKMFPARDHAPRDPLGPARRPGQRLPSRAEPLRVRSRPARRVRRALPHPRSRRQRVHAAVPRRQVRRDEPSVIDDAPAEPAPPDQTRAPSFVVGLRVVLLAIAAAAAAVAVTAGLRSGDGIAGIRYACPMHAEVRSTAPGECPICRMALERIGFVPGVAKPYLDVAGTIDLRAIDNVKKHNIVDFVRKHALPSVLRDLRGPAWVEDDGAIAAIFYNDQVAAIAPDEPGTFALGDAPDRRFAARRTNDRPVAWDRSTSRIRFRAANGRAKPPPGQIGWLEVSPRRDRC